MKDWFDEKAPHLPHNFSTHHVVVWEKHLFHQLEVANGDPTLEKRISGRGRWRRVVPIGGPKFLTFFEASNPVRGTESPSSLSIWAGVKLSTMTIDPHLERLEDELFVLWHKSRVEKKYGEMGQAKSNAMHESPTHPDGLVTPGNLLGKPRLLIGFCLQLDAPDDERRKSRSECIRDPRDYDRAVGERQANG